MKYLLQTITIIRIMDSRLRDTIRSWYWIHELRRRGALVEKGLLVKKGANISLPRQFKMKIGPNFQLSENSRIHLGDGAELEIGAHVFIGVNSVLAVRSNLNIGSNTQIAHNVTIIDHDHHFDLQTLNSIGDIYPIKIGKNVWIATNALILKGVNISEGSVVAAGAIVTKSIPAHNLAMGNAAKNRPIQNESII